MRWSFHQCIYSIIYRKITPILFDTAMVLCIIVGCGNQSGKLSKERDSEVEKLRFSWVPKIVKNEGEMMEERTTRRG